MNEPMRPLHGKLALVTGASRGIGRAVAQTLAARGAGIIVHYNQQAAAALEVVSRIESEGGIAFAVAADLAAPHGVETLFQALDKTLERHTGDNSFDILVNNAGISMRAPIEAVNEIDFDRIMQVNFKAPFFIIQRALTRLRNGGRIINLSSMATRAAFPSMAAYAPSKAALEALTLLLATHLGTRGITVNAVLPGATATDMNPAASDPHTATALATTIALGRVGLPQDVAEVIAFLASDEARWITGQCIDASGGQRL
jgi:3-oxoacyl-[acyl-carrier protein] reductase